MIFEDWGSPVGEFVSTWLSELLAWLEDWLIPDPVPGCPPPPITWTGTVFRPTKGLLLAEGIFSIKWLGNLKEKPKCSGLECLNFQSCEKVKGSKTISDEMKLLDKNNGLRCIKPLPFNISAIWKTCIKCRIIWALSYSIRPMCVSPIHWRLVQA